MTWSRRSTACAARVQRWPLLLLQLESSLGMHSASATVALVGIVFLSMNLFANEPLLKDCQSSRPPDLCIYMAASSNGLVSLMLILTLLELCIACSVVALWLKANCCHLRKAISSLSNPGESRMPPKESKEIQSWISSKSVLHPGAQENTSLWATSPPSWCPSWEASTCGSILSVLTINSLISPGNGRTNVLLYASFLL